ncbi:MAG: asparagine--tRNA ligase [Candidatus Komeilibacteria bacterium]
MLARLGQLANFVAKEVEIPAWVYNLRSSGKITFLQLRDGSGWSQAIVDESKVDSKVWKTTNELTIESSVIIFGKVSKHPKKEEYEIQVSDIKVQQIAEEYPIGKKEHGVDFLMDQRHLWLRSSKQWAIQRVRNTVINSIFEFLNNRGYIKIDAPILTPNACEGTTELFEVPYFDEKAYLTQSGQLYIEAAIFSHGQVFDFGPVFRAEKSKTRRHLTEFWMMDAEAAWVEHEENMKIQEELIKYVVSKVVESCQLELQLLERDIEPLKKLSQPFIRMSYDEAIKKLNKLGSDIKNGEDLGGDDETLLTKDSEVPIFVEKWPSEIKAFYMKRDPQNTKLALCSDLIATEGHGEIIGGSQREDDYDELLKRIKERKFPISDWQWYLDLRKYGSVPHSGFGVGLERLVGWICNVHHVRETIPFPRTINRLRP